MQKRNSIRGDEKTLLTEDKYIKTNYFEVNGKEMMSLLFILIFYNPLIILINLLR